MTDIDIEWKDVAEKVEEAEFKDEKKAEYEQQQNKLKEQQADAEQEQQSGSSDDDFESIGLSGVISEVWNEVAVDKGYEPVSDKQSAFLQRHTERLEEKYLKDRMDMLPEIDAALAHVVVYLPKWLKHQRENKKSE